ncbi:MAG: endolytic transglycosylase MltG [Candidatus Methylomirabilales bacterium]
MRLWREVGRRTWIRFGTALVTVIVIAGLTAWLRGGPRPASSPRLLDVPAGSTGWEVAAILKDAGVVRSRWLFLGLTTLRGSADALKAGEYRFTPAMSILDVIRRLEEGAVFVHQITIPEGYILREIADRLAEEGLVDPARLMALATDPTVARRYELEATTLEGFLFPDTYHLVKGMSEEEILDTMFQRFQEVFTTEDAVRAERLGMSRYEIVVLASIIEKEAQVDAEKPIIAGVFYNRLRRGMRLEADPTVRYGQNSAGRLTRRELARDHPYNTYRRYGLPPGPIANPGRSSLEAALNPASVDYLYFVSKNDGTHYFSRTLDEHNRAVRQFQGDGRPIQARDR